MAIAFGLGFVAGCAAYHYGKDYVLAAWEKVKASVAWVKAKLGK